MLTGEQVSRVGEIRGFWTEAKSETLIASENESYTSPK